MANSDIGTTSTNASEPAVLPEAGRDWQSVAAELQERRVNDVNWRAGKAAVYVFHSGDDVLDVAHDAYGMFMSENGLGPAAFPSLAKMEAEVVDMSLGLQRAPTGAAGSMSSGGSESIILAMKACRDWSIANGRIPANVTPEVIVPYSAHPAFDKGAHLMGLRLIRVPTKGFVADVEAMAQAVTPSTMLIVGSAPCFPYGVVDPISALSDVAIANDLWLHVDACVGGFVAPFVRQLGEHVPDYDFSLPGVRSISADLHKYGYAAKGASTVLYRETQFRDAQVFEFGDWPCGPMFTPTIAGTRPGGAIAAAWAVMQYLGASGYRERAARIVRTRKRIAAAVSDLGFEVFGDPCLSLITFGGDDEGLDILAIGAALVEAGWFSSRTRQPPGIHYMVSPEHDVTIEQYLMALSDATALARTGKLAAGKVTRYS